MARIGDKAFDGCASLTSILVDSGNEYFRSAGNCLIDINEKTVLKGCGTSVIPDDGSVTRIASYAFFDAEQAITLPDCITDIGEKAFNTMKSDTLEEYGSGFYAGTKTNPYYALISIGNNCDIHPGTVIIADSAYDVYSASESSVVELKIPAAVTRIGNYAFSGLNVDSICIPASVKEIGEGAFSQCHPLKTIQYKGTQDEWEKIAIGEDNESLKSADILFVRNNAEETEKPQNENRNPASTGNKKGNDMENGKGYVPFVVVIVSSVIIVAAGGLILFLMRKKED